MKSVVLTRVLKKPAQVSSIYDRVEVSDNPFCQFESLGVSTMQR